MSEKQLLQAQMALIIFLLIIALVFDLQPLLIFAAALGLLFLIVPTLGWWAGRAWLKFALALGKINAVIILTIVYFIFLTPIAFFSRLFRGNPIRQKSDVKSFFLDRSHEFKKGDLEEMW